MHGFARVGRHYVASLNGLERRILAGAVADTAELLGVRLQDESADDAAGHPGDAAGPFLTGLEEEPAAPSDPALARLLPPASRDDDELAAEFRRLTEAELRATKVANLRLVWSDLRGRPGSLLVSPEHAPRWAAALSDVRLVLASRLGIGDDADAERIYGIAAEDPQPGDVDELEQALATLYAALTWLQESLMEALLDDGGRRRRRET